MRAESGRFHTAAPPATVDTVLSATQSHCLCRRPRFIVGEVEPEFGAGPDDFAVLEASIPGEDGPSAIRLGVRYGALHALRECLAPADHEAFWGPGLLFGTIAENVVVIEDAAAAPVAGREPVGIFRAQPGGPAELTQADRKQLKSAGVPCGLVLVVRTLPGRPWSATLFTGTSGARLVEFPVDEYLLRHGWIQETDAPPPATPARRRGLRDACIALGIGALAGAGVMSWPSRHLLLDRPPARPLGLHVSPSGDDYEISWNRLSEAVRGAAAASLTIRNGPVLRVVALRPEELRRERVLVHPLPDQAAQLSLQVVDPSGRTQTETLEVAGRPGLGPPEPPDPKPSPLLPPVEPDAPPAQLSEAPEPVRRPRLEPIRAEVLTSARAVPIRRVSPEITPKVRAEMRQAHRLVTVTVQVSVDASGNVNGAMVLSSTGEPSPSGPYIRLASLDAARRWKFRPAIAHGARVPSKTTLVFSF